MARIGTLLALMGAISGALSFTDYELRLFFWMENFGTGAAWAIRLAFVVGGLALIAAETAKSNREA